jgi:hypothetical protein
VAVHVSSKSVSSVRERLRLCKKKELQIEGLPEAIVAPAGGIDKKAAGKVNSSPRKASASPRKAASKSKAKVKKENNGDLEDAEAIDVESGMNVEIEA